MTAPTHAESSADPSPGHGRSPEQDRAVTTSASPQAGAVPSTAVPRPAAAGRQAWQGGHQWPQDMESTTADPSPVVMRAVGVVAAGAQAEPTVVPAEYRERVVTSDPDSDGARTIRQAAPATVAAAHRATTAGPNVAVAQPAPVTDAVMSGTPGITAGGSPRGASAVAAASGAAKTVRPSTGTITAVSPATGEPETTVADQARAADPRGGSAPPITGLRQAVGAPSNRSGPGTGRHRQATRSRPRLVIDHRFVVDRPLGRGETAAVFSALDTRLHRMVTLKVLPREVARDDQARDQFFAEAQLYAAMSHNGVMGIFDVSTPQAATPWMVLERVDGVTLTQALRSRRLDSPVPRSMPFSVPRAMAVLDSALDGLRHAHDRSIIHGDISPASLVVSRDGFVRLVDFAPESSTVGMANRTRGTAHFVSPEHVQGIRLDCRSDVYSLTCVVFALLTGRPPFLGPDSDAVARAHCEDRVPVPSDYADHIPPWVDALVRTGLVKDPAGRYHNAGHMQDDLAACLQGTNGAGNSDQTRREHLVAVVDGTCEGADVAQATDPGRSEPMSGGAVPPLANMGHPGVQPAASAPSPSNRASQAG